MIKEIVEMLAVPDGGTRRLRIKSFLDQAGISYRTQPFYKLSRYGENIIIDVPLSGRDKNRKLILLTAHYDVAAGSPGANDNASAVAVLLVLLKKLINQKVLHPLRFIFFDMEEHRFLIGPDTNGSSAYIQQWGTDDIDCVVNLEMVGIGDSVLLWPIQRQAQKDFFVRLVNKIKQQGLFYLFMKKSPPLFNSDHLPFMQAGFPNVVTLTAFSKKDQERISSLSVHWMHFFIEFIKFRVCSRGDIPSILKTYHSADDDVAHIDEGMLMNIFNILYGLVIQ